MSYVELTLETIHESMVNGQREQAVRQIQEYGTAEFFDQYPGYLAEFVHYEATQYRYFVDVVTAYHRITA